MCGGTAFESSGYRLAILKRRMLEVYRHILQVDRHKPFSDACVKKIIERLDPDYLVHELMSGSRGELQCGFKNPAWGWNKKGLKEMEKMRIYTLSSKDEVHRYKKVHRCGFCRQA